MPSPTKKKGKQLIQTKLSFTTSSSQKGTKRTPEESGGMDQEMKAATAEAAEKRQRLQDDSCDDKLVDSSYSASTYSIPVIAEGHKKPESVGGNGDGAVASTSAEKETEDTEWRTQDLFVSDSENKVASSVQSEKLSHLQHHHQPWKGLPLEKLKTAPACLPTDVTLEVQANHAIGIKLPFQYSPDRLPIPYPSSYKDAWDDSHVRLPCSNQNQYPVKSGSSMQLGRRWELICDALQVPFTNSNDLEKAILTYNQRFTDKWSFIALHEFFAECVTLTEKTYILDHLLPQMVRLALKMPHLITQPIPLLKRDKAQSVTLSQQQIACLLANAFFCTFPRRNSNSRSSYPRINFNSLFQSPPVSRIMEKLKCIFHYFKRVCENMPKGLVTFSRRLMRKSFSWTNCAVPLTDLHVSSFGTIEDIGIGMLQVDFANKFLGGGVLSMGCVQEEIRFMICPEMLTSCLLTEVLGDLESLVMTGCEQFSMYKGYADSFHWNGDYKDPTPRDSVGRLCCEVVAIDAMVFRSNPSRQYHRPCVMRELNKAFCGFSSSADKNHRAAVCTGNWGCGAFGGDKQIKSLIQMMAASVAKRDVCYFTFGDTELATQLYKVHDLLHREEKNVEDIMKLLKEYHQEVVEKKSGATLFTFIHLKLEGTPPSPDFDQDSNEAQAFADMPQEDEEDLEEKGEESSQSQSSSSQEYRNPNTP